MNSIGSGCGGSDNYYGGHWGGSYMGQTIPLSVSVRCPHSGHCNTGNGGRSYGEGTRGFVGDNDSLAAKALQNIDSTLGSMSALLKDVAVALNVDIKAFPSFNNPPIVSNIVVERPMESVELEISAGESDA